jgi:type II secretory pathway pseudopilin PulG
MINNNDRIHMSERKDLGVTIIELLVVIFVIAIFIAFFVPNAYSRISINARITATKTEMEQLRSAIMGNPDLVNGGEYVAAGFKNDVGRLPRHLIELVTRRPDTTTYIYPGRESLSLWNPYIKSGWNGPYVRDDGKQSFMKDAWGEPYQFVVSGHDTVGLKSPGADGEWYNNAVPGMVNDDIQILF